MSEEAEINKMIDELKNKNVITIKKIQAYYEKFDWSICLPDFV